MMMQSTRQVWDKKHECELRRSSQTSRILSASCLQQGQVSGAHKSVYFSKTSKTHILMCSSLSSNHVLHSAYERSYISAKSIGMPVVAGNSLFVQENDRSSILNLWLQISKFIWFLQNSRRCGLVPCPGICLFSDRQSDAVSWVSWVHCVAAAGR